MRNEHQSHRNPYQNDGFANWNKSTFPIFFHSRATGVTSWVQHNRLFLRSPPQPEVGKASRRTCSQLEATPCSDTLRLRVPPNAKHHSCHESLTLPRLRTTYLPVLPGHTVLRCSLSSRKPRVSSQPRPELALKIGIGIYTTNMAMPAANIATVVIATRTHPKRELGWPCISLLSEAMTRIATRRNGANNPLMTAVQ